VYESSALGLEINWNKTNNQASDIVGNIPSDVIVSGHEVYVAAAQGGICR